MLQERFAALDRLQASGRPDRRAEAWMYADLSPFSTFDWLTTGKGVTEEVASDLVRAMATPEEIEISQTPEDQKALTLSHKGVFRSDWDVSWIRLRVGRGVHLVIYESSLNLEEDRFGATLVEATLEEGAKVHWVKDQISVGQRPQIQSIRIRQAQSSSLELVTLSMNSPRIRNNVRVELTEPDSSCDLSGLTTGSGEDWVDHHTFVDHQAPDCRSRELYKTILSDKAKAGFTGRIRVERNAQKTDSRQMNRSLLLGRNAEANSRPQLEIFADDVKCSHGATVGRLNPDEVFYLQSRGIDEKEAVRMLSLGFGREILFRVPETLVKARLSDRFEEAMGLLGVQE